MDTTIRLNLNEKLSAFIYLPFSNNAGVKPGFPLANAAVGGEVVTVHGGELHHGQLNLQIRPSLYSYSIFIYIRLKVMVDICHQAFLCVFESNIEC